MGRGANDDRQRPSHAALAGLVLLPLLIALVSCTPVLGATPRPAMISAPLHGPATALTTIGNSIWAAEPDPPTIVRTAGTVATRFPLAQASTGSAPLVDLTTPAPGSGPVTALAPRSATSVWYARPDAGVVGWLDQNGTSAETPLPGAPRYLASGTAGSVWVLETATGTLDHLSTSGAVIDQHAVGAISEETVSVVANGLATDAAGGVWMIRRTDRSELGRLDSTGAVTWTPIPLTGMNYPISLTAGPDGRMWGTAQSEAGGSVFRVNAVGGVEVATTFPDSVLGGAGTGPDGNLWCTSSESLPDGWHSILARIAPTGAVLDSEPIGTVARQAMAPRLASSPDTLWLSLTDRAELTGRVFPLQTGYLAAGGPSGLLGPSTGAEYPVVDGWARNFAQGRMYWSTPTGAHELHGLILDRFLTLGGPGTFLGLPTSDETATSTGTGRYNRFAGGTVLWSPPTGAHEVHGSIGARWAATGSEGGSLGYPTSDEFTPFPGARENTFQHGAIRWMANTGATSVLPS